MKTGNTHHKKSDNNTVNTKEGKLILDSHKLSYHYDRVRAWENGERIAPVSVDVALTRACGAMCSFCYAMVQEQKERSTIKVKEALDLVDGLAEVGVRGVSLISDGESTLSKAYVPFIKHAANVGIDVGNATNGWEWEAATYSVRFGGNFIPAPGSKVEISYKVAAVARNCGGQ